MTSKKATWVIGNALATAVIGSGIGIAIAAGEDQPLTGSALERATALALEHVGGGTVIESEVGDDGTGYTVEIRLEDGSTVEIGLDQDFKVIAQGADKDGSTDQEEPGEKEEAPDDQDEPIEGQLKTIPQPVVKGAEVAPESKRVDLAMPIFSNPTNVTNPLFPVSRQASVLMLGQVDDKPFRTEVTLLPDTRIIAWEGQKVETLVSQYVAYLDGRIHEVAYDLYAQDDAGSVWYFGEDVFNFDDGVIVDTHGTWIAGRDGPAAMIMPAEPKVGDVYRPENIPGLVFEEVTVKAVDQPLDGPLGPIAGGLEIEEFHLLDNSREKKTFAPGYGEFFTGGGGDVEALALAVPTDALSRPPPAELVTLETGAADIFSAALSKDWKSAATTLKKMAAAWVRYRTADVPEMIETRMTATLESLAKAIAARKPTESMQGAIDARQSSLDLQLRYRPPAEIDLARFDLWAAQILVDAKADDGAAVNGDFFTLDLIRDRILHALDTADVVRINAHLEELLSAVGDEDFAAVAEGAGELRDIVAGLQPVH